MGFLVCKQNARKLKAVCKRCWADGDFLDLPFPAHWTSALLLLAYFLIFQTCTVWPSEPKKMMHTGEPHSPVYTEFSVNLQVNIPWDWWLQPHLVLRMALSPLWTALGRPRFFLSEFSSRKSVCYSQHGPSYQHVLLTLWLPTSSPRSGGSPWTLPPGLNSSSWASLSPCRVSAWGKGVRKGLGMYRVTYLEKKSKKARGWLSAFIMWLCTSLNIGPQQPCKMSKEFQGYKAAE